YRPALRPTTVPLSMAAKPDPNWTQIFRPRESLRPPGPGGRDAARDRRRLLTILDGGGALLVAATIGMLLLPGLVSDADAGPAVSLLLLATLAYGVSTVVSRNNSWIVAFQVTVAAAVYAIFRLPTLYSAPHSGPLGYANAAGALFM